MKKLRISGIILSIVFVFLYVRNCTYAGREISEKYFITQYYEMQHVVELFKLGELQAEQSYFNVGNKIYTHQVKLPFMYSHLSDGGKIYVSYESGFEVTFIMQKDFSSKIWAAYLYSDNGFGDKCIQYYGVSYTNWSYYQLGG